MRDPNQPLFLMEVYVPTLFERGNQKVKDYEAFMRNLKPEPHFDKSVTWTAK